IWVPARERGEPFKPQCGAAPKARRTISPRQTASFGAALRRVRTGKRKQMVGLFGGRGASAVIGLIMLAIGSSGANAQNLPSMSVPAAINSVGVDAGAKPLGNSLRTAGVVRTVATTTAVTTASGAVLQAQPAQTVTLQLTAPSI